ncbi:hypothetical protein MCOR27_003888 [Pyricularia oryzae]|uniref:Aminoglycoside phosphotransferase domain-containing protein n=2 Tax=Pyricularia TaxID=48558 RepID=A0ABQ8NMN8_PYRGI|nr:hypothetical protein MCOR01_007493 [Pyricularia oryzae]KAI6299378.1 hypothetical protein MCOR33_004707 [Pyricularia grisea]KAH9433870.1 hypothetical protein MCOR02_005906 [Pyricularia oryzae]KAI6252980.1 hypothetical protein MCOR19_010434 [Pyricularia oryzae]KAI6264993.1 hypothetical protein MCOR26_011003 [Pyricularia oryzae]
MSPRRLYHLEPPHEHGSNIPRSPSCSSSEASIFSRPSSPESDSNDDDTPTELLEFLRASKSTRPSLSLDVSPETLNCALVDLNIDALRRSGGPPSQPLTGGRQQDAQRHYPTREPPNPRTALPLAMTGSPGPRNEAFENYLSGLRQLGSRESEVYLLDQSTIIKMGDEMLLHEASVLQFVAENTSVPVPRVLGFGRVPGTCDQAYMFMDRIAGDALSDVWDELDAAARSDIAWQLRDMYRDLRAHKHNSVCGILVREEARQAVDAATGNSDVQDNGAPAVAARTRTVYDQAGCTDNFFGYPVGPFDSEPDFVNELAHVMMCRGGPECLDVVPMLEDLAASRRPHPKNTYLTHGQLNPKNILIRDGRVVGLLDWSESGFYPEWWEYVKAHFDGGAESFVGSGAVSYILGEDYPAELETMLHARDLIW